MCGIAGIITPNPVTSVILDQMSNALAHRGPDDEGMWLGADVSLIHRRLSIIDIDGGHQPMLSPNSDLIVVFNGEIYNYPELRENLLAKGRHFLTHCDTEILLHLYDEYGVDFVTVLRGMFAFALWDVRKRQLLLARDHLGQKPLFYYYHRDSFAFASEIKALFSSEFISAEIDLKGFADHLGLRFCPGDTTLFKGVKKVEPGHVLLFKPDTGEMTVRRYWQIDHDQRTSLSFAEATDKLESLVEESVKIHLLSDVPVGGFLSGGVDSSLVSAFAAKHLSGFQTFSVGPNDKEFSELPFAKWAASTISSHHRDYEFNVETDLLLLLPDIIWHLEEPADTHAVGLFLLNRMAREHVKVVIGGDGADELFGGYVRFIQSRLMSFYGQIPKEIRKHLLGPLLDWIPDSYGYYSLAAKARWVHAMSLLDGAERQYCSMTFFGFPDGQREKLFHAEVLSNLGETTNTAQLIAAHYDRASSRDDVARRLYTEQMTRMPEHFLQIADRMSMAHSMEQRAPLVDKKIAEFAAALPSDYKILPGNLKIILREVARRHYPAKLIDRQKMGFKFPLARWFKGPLLGFITNALGDAYLFRDKLFEKSYVEAILDEHKSGRVDHNLKLWNLLNLEVWYRLFIVGDSKFDVSYWLADLLRKP
jgi:asparagine synthase (glutamine-hydrolysing)